MKQATQRVVYGPKERKQLASNPDEIKSVTGSLVELVDLMNKYFRQEMKATVEGALVKPIRRLAFWFSLTIVASTLLALALVFLSVGAFQLLALKLGHTWIAYLVVGAGFLAIALILAVARKGAGRAES